MLTDTNIFGTSYKEMKGVTRSTAFSKAVLLSLAMFIPIFLGIKFQQLALASLVSMGVMMMAPNDVGDDIRIKSRSILISTLLVMTVIFLTGSLSKSNWVYMPVFGLMVFCISYLAVFGFLASLISLSGLLALVFSFITISDTETQTITQTLLIGLGGIWYLLFVWIHYWIYPRELTDELLNETFDFTADYLQTRGELISAEGDRKELLEKLFGLQNDLAQNHEKLRNLLIRRRRNSGKSDSLIQRLMIFDELVEILELAVANPVDYEKMDEFMVKTPELGNHFQDLLNGMANRLRSVSANYKNPDRISRDTELRDKLQVIREEIESAYKDAEHSHADIPLLLSNFLQYQSLQIEKTNYIRRLLINPDEEEINDFRKKDFRLLITKQDYNLNILKGNFNLRSPIFRHSLRITTASLVGYIIGIFLGLHKFYWILLTILVIMRPNYGLTKSRSKQRTLGTLIGAVFAIGIIYLFHSHILYGVLAVASMILSYSMIQKNYKLAAIFMTLSVIMIFALKEPDIYKVIQFRIVDTAIGALIAVAANLLLWPSWEIDNINKTLISAIDANKNFMQSLVQPVEDGSTEDLEFKKVRKEAFLESSALTASFQRMAQEPKSKQKYLGETYHIVLLNYNFLSTLSSLNTYLQYNPEVYKQVDFRDLVSSIGENLDEAAEILDKKNSTPSAHVSDNEKNESDKATSTQTTDTQLQAIGSENNVLSEQLKWLVELSEKTKRAAVKLP